MSDTPDPVEQIAFLARSDCRVRILERLLRDGPTAQRELRDRLDASRSTITRSLAALEERGWVERDGRPYRLTPTGEIVADGFLDLAESIRAANELSTFLDWFPYADYPIDLAALRDADITASAPGEPYAPARKQTGFVERASRFRGFLPSVDIEGTRVVHEQVVDGAFEAEVLLSPGVEETITSGEYAELFRAQVETGRLTLLIADEELPFYLGLADEGSAQIGVEDDEGFPRALLETDAEAVYSWAEDVYGTYRDRARVKPASEF